MTCNRNRLHCQCNRSWLYCQFNHNRQLFAIKLGILHAMSLWDEPWLFATGLPGFKAQSQPNGLPWDTTIVAN